ncbi:unnamed protein product, partial [Tilletia caries]
DGVTSDLGEDVAFLNFLDDDVLEVAAHVAEHEELHGFGVDTHIVVSSDEEDLDEEDLAAPELVTASGKRRSTFPLSDCSDFTITAVKRKVCYVKVHNPPFTNESRRRQSIKTLSVRADLGRDGLFGFLTVMKAQARGGLAAGDGLEREVRVRSESDDICDAALGTTDELCETAAAQMRAMSVVFEDHVEREPWRRLTEDAG